MAIVVGQSGTVYAAPVGTAAPTSATSALDAAWKDLGYIDEDGVMFEDEVTIAQLRTYEAQHPSVGEFDQLITKMEFRLIQFNKLNVELALGGIISTSGGEFKYTPDSATHAAETALIIDWSDSGEHYRIYFPIGTLLEGSGTILSRLQAMPLPLQFAPLQIDTGQPPYTLFTDAASFDGRRKPHVRSAAFTAAATITSSSNRDHHRASVVSAAASISSSGAPSGATLRAADLSAVAAVIVSGVATPALERGAVISAAASIQAATATTGAIERAAALSATGSISSAGQSGGYVDGYTDSY